MTNDVKNVPGLRFPGFSGEWETKELGDRVKFYSGLTYTPNDVSKNGTLVLRSSNIFNNHIINADNVYVNSDKATSTYVEYGDVVVVVRNGSRNLIGKHAVIKNEESNAVIGAFMTGIRYEFGSFINALLSTQNFQKEIHKNLGATINQITTGIFKKMTFYFPKKQEEQKIGEFFSKLDRQIELEEQKLEKLKEQKKGYMQQIFSQELRFKDESENDYPEWKERKFSELLSYSSNGVDKKINKNHDIAYMVNYMDVFKKTKLNTKNRDLLMEITATKVQKEKNNLKKGDILFTPSSETREDIAKSTVVFEDLDNTVYSYHLIRLRPLDSNIFSLKYSNYLSEQNFISKQFRRLAQGAQRYTLTKEYFENIKLNLPHIKEQEKIGDFFSKLDEVINKQSQKIDELKLRKQGFLQKMFV
jgi:type I restriction enzyme S subunit